MNDLSANRESEREGLDFSAKPSAFVSPSMLSEAIRRGWQVTPERKKKYFEALDEAVDNLGQIADRGKRAQVATQCARVLVQEQAAALRDIHHTEQLQHEDGVLDLRMRRAEEGLPNDSLTVQVTPVEQLPLPPALAAYTKRILGPS